MVEGLPRTRSGGRIAARDFRDREGRMRTVTEIVVSRRQDTVNVLSEPRAQSAAAQDEDPGAGAEEGAEQA